MHDNDNNSALIDFTRPLKVGLSDSRSATARTQIKKGRLVFDAAKQKFTAFWETKNEPVVELSKLQLCPLKTSKCPTGRNLMIGFKKEDRPKFNELVLAELSEADKQLIHKYVLKLVGVSRGKINKPAPGGNQTPYPTLEEKPFRAFPPRQTPNQASTAAQTPYQAPEEKPQRRVSPPRPVLPTALQPQKVSISRTPLNMASKRPLCLSDISIDDFASPPSSTTAHRTFSPSPVNGWRINKSAAPIRDQPPYQTPEKRARRAMSPSHSFASSIPPHRQKTPLSRNGPRPMWLMSNGADDFASPTPSTTTTARPGSSKSPDEMSNKENVQLIRPAQELELPEKYTQPDFWKNLKMDEKIRSGISGEWIKGQDEQLTVDGLLCLKDGEWLNADMIDAYLSFITKQSGCQRVLYIPTYAILSYTRKRKIPSKWYWQLDDADLVLAPAHLNNNHWAMAVVDIHKRTIKMMDSMNNGFRGETKREFMETILKILIEVADQQGMPQYVGAEEDWAREEELDVPQQKNGTDCGIFALLYARFAAERRAAKEFPFDQLNIPYYRRRMCYDIVASIL